ncbi:MAG: MG2 domain-containing protein [Bacteroidales bacterium]
MNKKILRVAVPVVVVIAGLVFLIARAGDPLKLLKPDPAFRDYITGYTSGVIQSRSAIQVRLTHPYADSLLIGKKADPALFGFNPSVDGEVFWIDSRTVEFRPAEPMKQNTTYTCTFKLSMLKNVPEMFREFVFQFHTIRQGYEVKMGTPEIFNDDASLYSVSGSVLTADQADADKVREMLEARHNGNRVDIRWGEVKGMTDFSFRIDSLVRSSGETELVVAHRGQPIGVKRHGEEKMGIAGTGQFSLIDVHVVSNPDQYVVITFSDPLDQDQDLDGLVRLGSIRNLKFTIEQNQIKVYPNYTRNGELTLVVEPEVRSISGRALGKRWTRGIDFEAAKPAVRMVGEGSILPSTNGLLFPFEALHLKAVDVKVQKIYEKNVPQFLQVNELGGSNEMYRVATTVYSQRLDLTQTTGSIADFGQWHRYALDLSKLIAPERGAIYRVILSFRREYSTYPCGDAGVEPMPLTQVDDTGEVEGEDDDEDESWAYMGDYDYDWYDYDDYDWSERHNPCSKSYYYYKSVSRNILSSDIGLIAKAGSDGELICFATDIITAMPQEGMDIQVLDFQMQVMGSGKSDRDGRIAFRLKKTPFLVIAKRGDERGYLKLGEANALSMSLFDVDGQKVQHGVKGFLYAERGVWRPGDTMFIHFILEDKEKQFPADIPVLFELSDPQGNVVRRMVANHSVKGIYAFHTWTDESAVTGNYLGKVTLGNLAFSRYFKVETVKPNRLKIDLRFPDERIESDNEAPGTLEARWLHGALAPGLKADVSMTLEKGQTKFTGFDRFIFDDPAASFHSETTVVFDGNLDQAGKGVVKPGIELEESVPGVLKASFMTKVYEPGGDFSINTITVPYYPFQTYAGLMVPKGSGWWDMLESGKKHQFQVANVETSGKGVSSGRMMVEIYRIDWQWWWQNNERGLPYFLSNTEAVPVFTADVPVRNGRGQFTWGVDASSWGRYWIRVTDQKSGHTTGKVIYMDYPGWGRRSGQMREGASMLTISTDKSKYSVGEQVNVTIPSSPAGMALMSIESGTKVLQHEWIRTDSGTTRFTFTVTPEMSPNVYMHVMLLQPHRQTYNDMPVRMYGVVPVLVEDPATHLKPVIAMPGTWEAESEVSITVSESTGRPMAYTLAIVDEGLLDLTGFRTPDPWKHFYGKEALGVRTWDLFAEVIGAMVGGFERLLSIGGGDTRINYDKQKTRRFTPVVRSFGPVYLEAGKSQTHRFKMPQYVGSVRVMVVAAHEGAYGNAERTAEVKSPLMVLGTLPRIAGPGEIIDLPVNVFAMDQDIKSVQVQIAPGGLFEAVGETSKRIRFSSPGDQVVSFRVRVKEQVGEASVNILATSGSRRARHTISMEVRNANPPETRLVEKTLAPGETWSDDLLLNGMIGTNSGSIEFASIPPLNLGERLDYLIRYPHGCLEQTLAAAFPQLLLRNVIELDKRSMAESDVNIKAAIKKLSNHFMSDGAFSYWPNGSYYNAWTNSFAGHFMIEAEKNGFALPDGMKKRWISGQKRLASSWQASMVYRNDDLIQAYRLYTLALAGQPEMGAMNRLRSASRLSNQAKWRLAAAYALAGKTKTAQALISDAPREFPAYQEYGYTFGTPIRDKAMVVETLLLLNDGTGAATEVKSLVTALNSTGWMNTQTTAWSLISVGNYLRKVSSGTGINCTYSINGKTTEVNATKAIWTAAVPDIEKVAGKRMTIKNNSQAPLFVKVRLTGVPVAGKETAANRKITMSVEYLYMDGRKADPTRIQQGKDFMARVTVASSTADFIEEMALSQIFPSGWQIHNTRLTGVSDARTSNDSQINYQDIRDDRVLTYFNLGPFKSKTFTVMLNATYTGRFYMPGVHCEAMYVQDTYARTAGSWVEVVQQ